MHNGVGKLEARVAALSSYTTSVLDHGQRGGTAFQPHGFSNAAYRPR